MRIATITTELPMPPESARADDIALASRDQNANMPSWLLSAPAVMGILYSVAWLVGLAIWPANLDVTASGAAVIASYAGHRSLAMVQCALVEGVAAVALAGVVLAQGRAAHHRGADTLRRAAVGSGLCASTLSLAQCALGLMLAGWVVPAGDAIRAGVIFALINRIDGVKMLVLAAMALAGVGLTRPAGELPRWLGIAGAVLAVALIASGIGYLLLNNTLALAAALSLPLLLIWVSGTGITLARSRR
jgi:hypothetical protein